ncbi:hypothetical protein KAR91_81630 [Candidatus Pacearchaeota archaeon]|nr:hypothetical protein [Candidatus Pacearchaeota archaeon]
MGKNIIRISKVLVLLVVVVISKPTWAMMASDLQNLRIIGYHFTTSVSSDKSSYYSKNPLNSRIVVFKFSAKTSSNDGVMFLNDFLLRYFHDNGKEDRTSAIRICSAETSLIGEENNCLVSKSGWIKIGTGDVLFTVAFFLENEIKNVEIHRFGNAEAMHYSIGSERPYSIFISTNQGTESIAEIIKVIKTGGYRVLRSSNNLDPKAEGITIYYAKSVEVQAREISQRIMTKTSIAPTIKESSFSNADSDVVIWIGKYFQQRALSKKQVSAITSRVGVATTEQVSRPESIEEPGEPADNDVPEDRPKPKRTKTKLFNE